MTKKLKTEMFEISQLKQAITDNLDVSLKQLVSINSRWRPIFLKGSVHLQALNDQKDLFQIAELVEKSDAELKFTLKLHKLDYSSMQSDKQHHIEMSSFLEIMDKNHV